MALEEENARLKAENAVLREQMTALVERVRDLEARLAKDSHTQQQQTVLLRRAQAPTPQNPEPAPEERQEAGRATRPPRRDTASGD